MSRSESSCKKSPMEKVVPLRCLDRDYNGDRTCRRVRSLLPAKTTPQIANDPTARHLVPEDQQTALACDAEVRARHGLSLAFFAKHPAEPYRSRVGFSKLQIGSPIRSFFCWSTNTRLVCVRLKHQRGALIHHGGTEKIREGKSSPRGDPSCVCASRKSVAIRGSCSSVSREGAEARRRTEQRKSEFCLGPFAPPRLRVRPVSR